MPTKVDAVAHWKVISADKFDFHLGVSPQLSLGDFLKSLDFGVGKRVASLLKLVDVSFKAHVQVLHFLHPLPTPFTHPSTLGSTRRSLQASNLFRIYLDAIS